MSNIVMVDNGILRKADNVELAEKIIQLRKQKDAWVVIDELLKAWSKRAPEEVDAFQIQIREYRENLIDKRFGQTKGGKDFGRRFILSFPKILMLMIRTQYKADELPMDSKFFAKFAKRYPFFKIPDKI
ncbi:MAG: hypothetical protein AABY22_33805 [Nanoarchaeota archaeon]